MQLSANSGEPHQEVATNSRSKNFTLWDQYNKRSKGATGREEERKKINNKIFLKIIKYIKNDNM